MTTNVTEDGEIMSMLEGSWVVSAQILFFVSSVTFLFLTLTQLH